MKEAVKVLARCLAVEFYKQNSAFFGLIFLVFFGFIKSQEHIAIGSFLVANPSSLFFLYVLWAGYTIKVMLFVLPTLNHEENQFLEAFYLMTSKIKLNAAILISVMLLFPIIVYTVFLISLAIHQSFILSIVSIAVSLFFLIAVFTLILIKKLDSLPHEHTFVQIRFLNRIN